MLGNCAMLHVPGCLDIISHQIHIFSFCMLLLSFFSLHFSSFLFISLHFSSFLFISLPQQFAFLQKPTQCEKNAMLVFLGTDDEEEGWRGMKIGMKMKMRMMMKMMKLWRLGSAWAVVTILHAFIQSRTTQL